MTPQERTALWLSLALDAKATANDWRDLAREWPADAHRYLASASEAYLRALQYLKRARVFKAMEATI